MNIAAYQFPSRNLRTFQKKKIIYLIYFAGGRSLLASHRWNSWCSSQEICCALWGTDWIWVETTLEKCVRSHRLVYLSTVQHSTKYILHSTNFSFSPVSFKNMSFMIDEMFRWRTLRGIILDKIIVKWNIKEKYSGFPYFKNIENVEACLQG